MAVKEKTYRGQSIAIEDDKTLTINGKKIDYDVELSTGKWHAPDLPYTHYDSLEELGDAIVNSPSGSDQLEKNTN